MQSFAKQVYKNIPGSEGNIVKNFLTNSHEFKKMSEIALTSPSTTTVIHNGETTKINSYNDMVERIKQALTFAEILDITDRFNFSETSNDETVKKIGRNGMVGILFFGGYFNNEANFGYYAALFREKAIKEMALKGISAERNAVAEAVRDFGRR